MRIYACTYMCTHVFWMVSKDLIFKTHEFDAALVVYAGAGFCASNHFCQAGSNPTNIHTAQHNKIHKNHESK